MIDPNYYLFADLSITEIEGPAEFFDWEAEERIINQMYDWKSNGAWTETQDVIDAAPADAWGDDLAMLENLNELISW